jgi:uncharacterized protein YjaZ
MKIHFAESKYWEKLPANFRPKYTREIKRAFEEVSKLLPFGSKHVNFFVQPRTYGLIEETGDNARTLNSEFIELAFDPTRDTKGLKVILSGVRPAVYHEMNHAARFNIPIFHKTFLDNCVLEGLATVFTRDYAGEDAGWAKYPKNVADWLQEIVDKNDMFYWQHYMFKHPDGRRWMGYKVGTYIIDQAMKNSGKSVIELTKLECKDILKLSKVL